MGQDRGQLVVILGNRQQSRKHHDLAGGQTERVDLAVPHDVDFPLEPITPHPEVDFPLQGLDTDSPNDAGGDMANAFDLRLICRQDAPAGLAEDLPVGLSAKLQFLIRRQREHLGPVAGALSLVGRCRKLASQGSNAADQS